MKNKDYNDFEKSLTEFIIEAPSSELRTKVLFEAEKNWETNNKQPEMTYSWNRFFLILKYATMVTVVLLMTSFLVDNSFETLNTPILKANRSQGEVEMNRLWSDVGLNCKARLIYNSLREHNANSSRSSLNNSSWLLIRKQMEKLVDKS